MRRRDFLALLSPAAALAQHPCPAPQDAPDFTRARRFEPDETWTRQLKPRPYLDRLSKNTVFAERLSDAYAKLQLRADNLSLPAQGLWHRSMHISGLTSADDVAQCQDIHSNGMFLPWHRAFLYFHERSLAHTLGDASFRLPVWRWDLTGVSNKGLPPSFVTREWDPVFRDKISKEKRLSRTRWLLEITSTQDFERFGGGDNFGSAAQGNHSDIHALVGGQMADLATAAYDPLFYLHHANIDRHWAHWQAWTSACKQPGFRDLPDVLNGKFADVRFYFHDIKVEDPQAKPELVFITARQTIEYQKAFGYHYPRNRAGKLPACDGAVTEPVPPDANGEFVFRPKAFRKLKSIRVANIPATAGAELRVRMTILPMSGAAVKVEQPVEILPSHGHSHTSSVLFTGLKLPKKIQTIEAKMSDQGDWTKVASPVVLITSIPI